MVYIYNIFLPTYHLIDIEADSFPTAVKRAEMNVTIQGLWCGIYSFEYMSRSGISGLRGNLMNDI